jgi:cytochrome c556
MSFSFRPLLLTLVAGAVMAGAAVTSVDLGHAHSGASGVVKQRMDAMKGMTAAMKALKAAFDAGKQRGQVAQHAAATIRDTSGEHMTMLFPHGSLKKPSEAMPAVWEDRLDFEAQAEALHQNSAGLVVVLEGGAMRGRSIRALTA